MLDNEKFVFFGEVPPASENKSAKRKQLRCVPHLRQISTRYLVFFSFRLFLMALRILPEKRD